MIIKIIIILNLIPQPLINDGDNIFAQSDFFEEF
jgi:hypothetical protein